jgi:hypothetical protein
VTAVTAVIVVIVIVSLLRIVQLESGVVLTPFHPKVAVSVTTVATVATVAIVVTVVIEAIVVIEATVATVVIVVIAASLALASTTRNVPQTARIPPAGDVTSLCLQREIAPAGRSPVSVSASVAHGVDLLQV